MNLPEKMPEQPDVIPHSEGTDWYNETAKRLGIKGKELNEEEAAAVESEAEIHGVAEGEEPPEAILNNNELVYGCDDEE